MRRPLTIDIARPLPAKPGRADPAPECADTDHNALCVQIRGQQWHRPGMGVIAEPAWLAREELAALLVCQDRRRRRTTRPSSISKRGWRLFRQIALDPAIDGAASNTRAFGNHVHRLACGNLGNSLKASIKSHVARLSKRLRQTPAISPTECRIGRSGCVHPDTVDSARHLSQASCDKTPSPRLQIMPYFQGFFVPLRCIYVAKLLATYLARGAPAAVLTPVWPQGTRSSLCRHGRAYPTAVRHDLCLRLIISSSLLCLDWTAVRHSGRQQCLQRAIKHQIGPPSRAKASRLSGTLWRF
jgi:hypothetical protein